MNCPLGEDYFNVMNEMAYQLFCIVDKSNSSSFSEILVSLFTNSNQKNSNGYNYSDSTHKYPQHDPDFL
ncbi:MAG TPA: hypothetical protein VI461_01920 [Chitinophagaceae bacterium]|nr:hypothetical protein [Chitinophagaceae bacterium]